jgi:hypothetical protein
MLSQPVAPTVLIGGSLVARAVYVGAISRPKPVQKRGRTRHPPADSPQCRAFGSSARRVTSGKLARPDAVPYRVSTPERSLVRLQPLRPRA